MTRLTSTVTDLPGRYAPPAPDEVLTAVSADGAKLYVEVHGDAGAPAVVLAHGWTCSTAFWAPVVRRLTNGGHRVVVYDQRGHGRTPAAVPEAYSPAALADDLCAVLDAVLASGERAVVGGHSMGGMTLMAAAGRPELEERAAAVMLCSTGAHRLLSESRILPLRPVRARAAAHRVLLGSRAPLGPVTPVSRAALKYGTLGRGASREQAEVVARIVHACPTRTRAAWGDVLAELDLAARVGRLAMPAAVVAGTDDRLTPLPHARELAGALPDCVRTLELTGMGHMTPIEAPEIIADLLAGLVRDHLTAPAGGGVPEQRTEPQVIKAAADDSGQRGTRPAGTAGAGSAPAAGKAAKSAKGARPMGARDGAGKREEGGKP